MDILSDENYDFEARLILYALERLGLQEILNVQVFTFGQVELPRGSSDETVWQFCQTKGYLLLTGNRTATDGDRSLEMVLRRVITDQSLPVLTIGDKDRVKTDPAYCEKCAESVANIVWGLTHYGEFLGTPRLYIPLPT